MGGHVSYSAVSLKATKLGLCNSLLFGNINFCDILGGKLTSETIIFMISANGVGALVAGEYQGNLG